MDKYLPSACAVYHCRALYIGINVGKSGFGGLIHKRKGHNSRGNHSGPPGENDRLLKDPIDGLSNETVLSENDDQDKTDNSRRQNEWKHKKSFESRFSEK